ncbi:hypothetical protein JI667_11915 [Bacillus sp. NTK074B]|nr:hypothetical protein [Bacillus sp. NTK074B]
MMNGIPTSCYELAEGPEMLGNESEDVGSDTFRSEIWIPVGKKLERKQ